MKKNDTALNMLLPNKLYTDAKNAAESRNIPMAALVRMALTEWLTENSEQAESVDIDEIFASMPGKEMKDG
ncbi:MAG: BrnA antitoxin family protein [Defluviitaleaceae bacterium]|nr:BrnA antitoxin family protein [Defluviitaleaceae bacterium]